LLPLLLLALVFRAAIPAGYMPVAADGGLRIAPCPGMVQQHPAHHSGHGSSHSESTLCPFAASALPPMPAVQVVVAGELASMVALGVPSVDPVYPFTLASVQQARAPPGSRLIRS